MEQGSSQGGRLSAAFMGEKAWPRTGKDGGRAPHCLAAALLLSARPELSQGEEKAAEEKRGLPEGCQ